MSICCQVSSWTHYRNFGSWYSCLTLWLVSLNGVEFWLLTWQRHQRLCRYYCLSHMLFATSRDFCYGSLLPQASCMNWVNFQCDDVNWSYVTILSIILDVSIKLRTHLFVIFHRRDVCHRYQYCHFPGSPTRYPIRPETLRHVLEWSSLSSVALLSSMKMSALSCVKQLILILTHPYVFVWSSLRSVALLGWRTHFSCLPRFSDRATLKWFAHVLDSSPISRISNHSWCVRIAWYDSIRQFLSSHLHFCPALTNPRRSMTQRTALHVHAHSFHPWVSRVRRRDRTVRCPHWRVCPSAISSSSTWSWRSLRNSSTRLVIRTYSWVKDHINMISLFLEASTNTRLRKSCSKNSRKTWQCVGVQWLTNQKSSWVVLCAGHHKITYSEFRANTCSRLPTHSVSRKSLKVIPFWTTLGKRRHRQLLGRLLWLDRSDIKNAASQLPTHVGTATTRDEINIKRLLRYLAGTPASNMIVGCNLDVPGIACIPQGSVLVMTDRDWAGDVKDRRSCSGIAVWVKGSAEETWYPVYASSKKRNMVCLSSGESELMALVGGACEGIATRNQWSKVCNCSPGAIAAQQRWNSWSARVQVDALVTWTRRSTACRPGETAHLESAWWQSTSRWLPH